MIRRFSNLALLAGVALSSSAFADISCSGYINSSVATWAGNYTVTASANSARLTLVNGYGTYSAVLSPDPQGRTPHGMGFIENGANPYKVSTDTPYGARPGLSISVNDTYLGRLENCQSY